MASGTILIAATLSVVMVGVTAQKGGSCRACNCRFNNIEVVIDIIDARIDAKLSSADSRINSTIASLNSSFAGHLANQPVVKIMYIGVHGGGTSRSVRFQPRDPSTWALVNPRTDLSIPNTNNVYTSSNNMVAYRPNYRDAHNSNPGALFFNLQALFPCLNGTDFHPTCSLFTSESDGFRGGKPFLQAADVGNSFRIFSSTTNFETFGFAIMGCSTFDGVCVSDLELDLVCLLPRNRCA